MYFKEDNHFVEAIKVRSRVQSLTHEIFLDESISEPEYYRNVVSLLRNEVGEKDIVEVIISNGGGLVHTASLITDAMDVCKGKIIGHLSGQCCSAATKIAMHCDEWVVGNNLNYMLHNITYGLGGKATDIHKQQEFTKEWGDKLFRDTYTGFLTEDEIDLTLKYGEEFWFDTEEVKERLSNFAKYRSQQQASAMEEMYTFQDEQADKYEKILVNKLLEKGVITKEEADIAYKVQQASLKLDEEEGDQLITALNKPVIENTVTEEHSTVVKGNSREYLLYYHIFDGEVVLGDLDFDDYALPLTLSCAEECYLVLKAVAADLNVSKSHNIKPENLMKKLIAHLEQLVEESL